MAKDTGEIKRDALNNALDSAQRFATFFIVLTVTFTLVIVAIGLIKHHKNENTMAKNPRDWLIKNKQFVKASQVGYAAGIPKTTMAAYMEGKDWLDAERLENLNKVIKQIQAK